MSFGFGFGFTKITAAIRAAFSPSSLFAANEPGVWYDPSDLSTLYQDSAGTIPVTAVEQPVGLMLDKSKGLVLGPELVTNGTFDTDINGWIVSPQFPSSTAVEWSNGALHVYNTQASYGESRSAAIPLTIGKRYVLEMEILAGTTASYWIIIGSSASNDRDGRIVVTSESSGTSPSGYKRWRYSFVASYATAYLYFATNSAAGSHLYADNISVRELPGNHASQPTATSRPVLSARVNLLTKTEDFSDAVWLKASSGSGVLPTVSADAGLSPVGARTADLITINRSTTTGLSFLTQRLSDDGTQKSRILHVKAFSASDVGKVLDTWTFDNAVANRFAITLTADWQKVTLPNVTLSAGGSRENIAFGYLDNGSLSPNTGEIKFYIWGASLVPANQASLPYQRVNTATDYDTTGFPYYLRFDGVDDWLVTPTITPGIDKVQVFAGVRKLSDSASAIAVEFSPDANTNNGSFYLSYPRSGTLNEPAFTSRGTITVLAGNGATSFTAPISSVLGGIGDISGDRSIQRVNGAERVVATSDQGTGNYLAYPLYIGRRGGTSLPFNGRLYSLIVRFGANLPIETIENTEKYVNTKTRAY